MPAQDGIRQAGGVLVFLQPILVGSHSLKLERVHRAEIGVAFNETIGVEQALDSFLGRLRKMIIAMRADALVLRQLDFVHDLLATGAFLEQPLRNIAAALAATAAADRRSLEDSHVVRRGRRSPRERKSRRSLSERARIRSAWS